MREPGGLQELDEFGLSAWQRRLEACFNEVKAAFGPTNFVVDHPDDRTLRATAIDWVGLPARVAECLTRARALELSDGNPSDPGEGPRSLQEEYIEWRVVRDRQGIRRVELTTELSDYWRVLAAYRPHRTLELVRGFARDTKVPPEAVYRGCDPLAGSTTPQEREAAFCAAMLSTETAGPYNDGRHAICCLNQRTNSVYALIGLLVAATGVRLTRDHYTERLRCLSSREAIALRVLADAAQAGRASDPVIVERLMHLAYEGRLVALDDPIGVYIQSVEHTRLRTPDGGSVPAEWFAFERGLSPAETSDGHARWQRLTFEVPVESGLVGEDLVDTGSEQPIRHGGQIAELVQVALVLRVSDRGTVDIGTPKPTQLAEPPADALGCGDLRRRVAEYGGPDRPTQRVPEG